ncbi:hypothetical protein LBMAG53_18370 [Planctomycetota bacterium]|nr:hypothetical protein LBMAG53_18370 [Planctomycetota bacterium]
MGEPLHPEFIAEARLQLDQAEMLLHTLDRCLGQADPGVLHAAYRAMHAVSALAGFLGLENIRILSQKTEEMLEELRLHRMPCTAARINLLLRTICRLRELVLGLIADARPHGVDQQLLRAFRHLFKVRLVRPRPRWRRIIPQARRFDWHGQQISTGPPPAGIL